MAKQPWSSVTRALATKPNPCFERLPYSSRFSANLSLQRDFPVSAQITGFAGGQLSYLGRREGNFIATIERERYPSFTRTDLQLGIKGDAWTATLSANNVTDKRGVLNGGLGQFPPFAFTYIQPRNIGLSFSRTFE